MIKEKRIEHKLTQEEMAKILNISLRQYARIDKEEDIPRKDTLKKLIDILELTNNEIGIYIRNLANKNQ